MVTMDDAVISRLKTGGKTFEILVDPEMALAFQREGGELDVDNALVIDDVFEDASTGDRVTEESLQNVFKTNDIQVIAERIIRDGELNLTTEQRKKMLDEKRRQVINSISRNAINPQTNAPHPPARIDAAMVEAKVHIDQTKSVEENVKIAVKALRPVIPLRIEECKMAAKIPPNYAGGAFKKLSDFGKIIKDEWQNDGSWITVLEIPAGMKEEFVDMVNNLTKGEGEVREIKQ
jgi:ribosome maturation protein SDO1